MAVSILNRFSGTRGDDRDLVRSFFHCETFRVLKEEEQAK
jgi:hypothetical protein